MYLSIFRIWFRFYSFIPPLLMRGRNCLELPDRVRVSAWESRISFIRLFCTISFSWTLLIDRRGGFLRLVLLYLWTALAPANRCGLMLTVLSSSIVIFYDGKVDFLVPTTLRTVVSIGKTRLELSSCSWMCYSSLFDFCRP